MGSKKKVSKAKPRKKKKKKAADTTYNITYRWTAEDLKLDSQPVERTEYDNEAAQAEMDDLQLEPKPVADDVRFLNPCPACTEPELYESFDEGRHVRITLGESGRLIADVRDYGSGISIKYDRDQSTTFIDYGTMDFLLRAVQIMNAMQDGSIFGDNWWTGPNNSVGKFNFLLQSFKDQRKTKKSVTD